MGDRPRIFFINVSVIVMHNNCYHLIMVSLIVLWQRINYVVDGYIQLCTFTDSMELYNF